MTWFSQHFLARTYIMGVASLETWQICPMFAPSKQKGAKAIRNHPNSKHKLKGKNGSETSLKFCRDLSFAIGDLFD